MDAFSKCILVHFSDIKFTITVVYIFLYISLAPLLLYRDCPNSASVTKSLRVNQVYTGKYLLRIKWDHIQMSCNLRMYPDKSSIKCTSCRFCLLRNGNSVFIARINNINVEIKNFIFTVKMVLTVKLPFSRCSIYYLLF